MSDVIKDLGEKIGGARKDKAVSTGPRRPRAKVETDTRPAWMRRFVAMEQLDRQTKAGTGKWSLVDMGQNERYGGRTVARDLPSKEAAEARIPIAAVARNHKVRMVSDPETKEARYEIWREVTDRKRVKVISDTFTSQTAALEYMANNAVKIIETKTGFGEEILAKPEKVYRKGPDVRPGDIAGEAFMKTVGARAVEFGNWQGERQSVMNHAYDAMIDLSHVTGIDPKDLSLKGDLAIAFGARGHGLSSARAHYEPRYGAINLTKLEGAGALAHEWWHGLDHMLGRLDDPKLAALDPKESTKAFAEHASDSVFASHRVDNPYTGKGQLPPNVREAYRDLIKTLYHKAEQYTEDKGRAEKFTAATQKELTEGVAELRKYLAEPRTYGKRNTKPASAEQLAKFDELAGKILSGEALKTDWRSFEKKASPYNRGYGTTARWTNDTLEAMNSLLKEVRGHSGFDSQDRRGMLDQLRGRMATHEKRQAMLTDAAAESVKTKMVPTEYSMQARRLDEGRVGDYWQLKHEMTARAFSAYVEDKLKEAGRQSDYLSYGSDNRLYAMLGQKPFPEGAERQRFNAAFDRLFDEMRKAELVRPAANLTAPGKAAASDVHQAMQEASAPRPAPEVPGKAETATTPAEAMKASGKPAGWSDEARAASAEARGVAAPGEAKPEAPKAAPEPAVTDPLAKARDIRARLQGAIKNTPEHAAAMKDWMALPVETQRAAIAAAKPAAEAAPAKSVEVRPLGKGKFGIFENGQPVKDSKGADKWFGSKDKADAFAARRRADAGTATEADRVVLNEQGERARRMNKPSQAEIDQKLAAAGRPRTAGDPFFPTSKRPARPTAEPRAATVGDNGGPSDSAIKAAERLEEVAKRTLEKAEAEAGRERKMNTPRRARMGSGMIERAMQDAADAKTALKIAEALRNGEAGALSNVRSLADIRELRRLAREAENATDRKLNRPWRSGGHGIDAADVANLGAGKGFVRMEPRTVEEIKQALAGKKGYANAIKTLERFAAETTRGDRTDFSTNDERVFEAVKKVATAIRKGEGTGPNARSLNWQAGRWLDEVRDFNRGKKLAGGTNPEGRQAALKAFLDVRDGKTGMSAAKKAELALVGQKIPGFFPTPESLAQRMAEMAGIEKGQTVLEPSAGSGRLADAAKARGAEVHAVETYSSLREILKAKGHNIIDSDFTAMKAETQYDRILMNPPFERGQDMAHVRQAYEMLKPGGKMVAIMGEHGFFAGDKQSTEFRNWFDQVGGKAERLPEGTFKESGTGVNTRLVEISKPAAVAEAAMKASTGEHAGWSDAARVAAADARGVARPGEAKPEVPAHIKAAADRAAAMADAKPQQQSTLARPAPAPAPEPVKTAEPVKTPAPLDHGELNIPGRTNGLNAEIDRHKAAEAKAAKVDRKAKAAATREAKAKAKQIVAERGAEMVARTVEKHGVDPKAAMATLNDMAKWQPEKLLDMAAKMPAAAHQTSTLAKPAAPAPMGKGLIGFQNEANLNAALKAQGFAEAGKAQLPAVVKPQLPAPVAAAKPPAPVVSKLPAAPTGKVIEHVAKADAKIGAATMVAAPLAAAVVGYHGAMRAAEAAGMSKPEAMKEGAKAGAVAGVTTLGFIGAVGMGIKAAVNVAQKAGPVAGKVAARAVLPLSVGLTAYGAYQGYQSHGWKGALLGTVGAEGLLDIGKDAPKAPAPAPEQPQGTPRGLTAERAINYSAANATYESMREQEAKVAEVNTFARQRHTKTGAVVHETVRAHTRILPDR